MFWITARAGNPLLTGQVLAWFNFGALKVQSSAASDLMFLRREISGSQPRPPAFRVADAVRTYTIDPDIEKGGARNVLANTRGGFQGNPG